VTHRILRDNDGRMRRMICQACPQNDDVSIGNVCHIPVSRNLGSYLITTARWSPERTLVIKDKAQGAFVQRRRRTFLGGTEFSRQPSTSPISAQCRPISAQCRTRQRWPRKPPRSSASARPARRAPSKFQDQTNPLFRRTYRAQKSERYGPKSRNNENDSC
jgi:hypothetical protein